MRTVRVPAVQAGLHDRAIAVRTRSQERIGEFAKNKLIEHQLMPRTSSFVPTFGDAISETRKSYVRLKTIFARALEKQVPYVEYTETPFLEIQDREFFSITLTSIPINYTSGWDVFNYLGSSPRRDYSVASPFGKPIQRYLKRLQFLCLKHGLPLHFATEWTIRATDRQRAKINKMTSDEVRRVNDIEIQIVATIRVSFVRWYNNAYCTMLRRGIRDMPSLEEYLEEQINEHGERTVFSPDGWTGTSLVRSRDETLTSAAHARYRVPEIVFFYLPHIQKVLRTLTRKAYYVPSAFSIGSVTAA